MNYNVVDTKRDYPKNVNESNTIVDCPYFTTRFIPLNGRAIQRRDGESFAVYMCTEGSFTVHTDSESATFRKGDTILIPAALRDFELEGQASLLEVYVRGEA